MPQAATAAAMHAEGHAAIAKSARICGRRSAVAAAHARGARGVQPRRLLS